MSGPTSDYLNYSSDLEVCLKSCSDRFSCCQIQDLNYSSDRLSCYQIQDLNYSSDGLNFQFLPSYLTIQVPKDSFFAMKLNQFIGLSRKMAGSSDPSRKK